MSPTFIAIGSLQIQWYSILLLIAFLIGFIIVFKAREKIGLTKNEITDLMFYLVIVCIIGARLYYVLFNFDYYLTYPLDIIKVWEGGLAIHGGIMAGLIYLLIYSYKKQICVLKFTDIITPALALGQSIGRWGNFFNQEAFGSVTTYNVLENMHIPKFIIEGMNIGGTYYHPTFLYESIWCFIIFIVLILFGKLKKDKIGLITSIYLIMYGIERFFIEGMRQDSLMRFNLKVAQIISIMMIFIGIILLIKIRRNYDK